MRTRPIQIVRIVYIYIEFHYAFVPWVHKIGEIARTQIARMKEKLKRISCVAIYNLNIRMEPLQLRFKPGLNKQFRAHF